MKYQAHNYTYCKIGRLTFVNIQDGRPRNITYVTDMAGQVMSRVELDNQPLTGDPADYSYYFNGVRMGQVGNNYEALGTDYVLAIHRRGLSHLNTPFSNGTNVTNTYGAFDPAYVPINPTTPGTAGTTLTVRDGDTLQGLALAIWGDAALWYLLAEANGLTATSALNPGQVITVPAKVGNVILGWVANTQREHGERKRPPGEWRARVCLRIEACRLESEAA